MKPLPTPDNYGNYWLEERQGRNIAHVPAIFPFKVRVFDTNGEVAEVKATGQFYLQLGVQGMLWEDGKLKAFKSPHDAFKFFAKAA